MNPTSLAEQQSVFMESILEADSDLPEGWGERHAAGMHIYRGNYRSALVESLRDTYPKTEEWAGEAPFKQAAINHVIAHPSTSWTIDEAGAGFDATCARFFKDAPEVAELAWLELTMLTAFSAPDSDPLDLEQFCAITSAYGEEEWINLRVTLKPDLHARLIDFDLHAMWNAEGPDARVDAQLSEPRGVFVWREDERATFQMVEPDEVAVLEALRAGHSYGELCLMMAGEDPSPDQGQEAAMRAGAILGRWVREGLVIALDA